MSQALENETLDNGLAALLDSLNRPEVRQSLDSLIDRLPQLTEMAAKLTQAYTLIQSVATDPVFVSDMMGGIGEIVTPVKDKAKGIASVVIEAHDRAREDTSKIGLLGLLRMMKDPQTQKAFRFTKALLETLNDKENGRLQA
jgi:uncharacterized protein YjgD (DUF1641 family)